MFFLITIFFLPFNQRSQISYLLLNIVSKRAPIQELCLDRTWQLWGGLIWLHGQCPSQQLFKLISQGGSCIGLCMSAFCLKQPYFGKNMDVIFTECAHVQQRDYAAGMWKFRWKFWYSKCAPFPHCLNWWVLEFVVTHMNPSWPQNLLAKKDKTNQNSKSLHSTWAFTF